MAGRAPLHSGLESEPLGERLRRFQINADISAILPVNFQQVLLAVFVPVSPLARSWALAAAWPSFLRLTRLPSVFAVNLFGSSYFTLLLLSGAPGGRSHTTGGRSASRLALA